MTLLSKLFAAAMLAALPLAVSAQEMRIANITVYEDINDTASIQTWVDQISALKYNAIAIHARYRGDATYFPNKSIATYPNSEPRSAAAGSIDVIQEFATRGHAKGLKVFAYVNLFLVTDGTNIPASPNHPYNAHSNWITYERNGGTPVKMTAANDPEGVWLDPGIPAVRDYNNTVCADIMANYDVDGLVIDRIRYPQTNWNRTIDFGYNPTAVSLFNAAYGKTGTPATSDTQWQAWRRSNINAQVQQIYNTITAMDPNHILLAFPIGRYSDAYNFNYCDWATWLNSNYIDGVLPQIYRDTNADFTTGCNEHIAAYSGIRLLGVATKAYVAGIDVGGQIDIARSKGFDGISPFRHASAGTLGYNTVIGTKFATAATWPAMSWKIPTTYIVDNTDAGFTASANWTAASSTAGYYGTNYRYRSTAAVSDAAQWSVNLPAAGSYKVYARWTAGSNRSATAPFQVVSTAGTTTVNMNQQLNNGTWMLLGTYNMAAGNAVRVKLSCWTTTGFNVVADAIKLEKQ